MMRSKPPLPDDAASIAVILPSWVGDAVMATPVYRALRRARPNARLIGLMRPGLDQLLAGNPWFDVMHASHPKGWTGFRASVRALRREAPEAILLLPNSFRSALIARLGRARHRLGYARDGRGWLLTRGLPRPTTRGPVSTVDYYAELAEWMLDGETIDRRPELFTTPAEHAHADELLRGVQRPFVVLNPGGNKPEKRWPAERFAALGRALRADMNVDIVVNGSPGERDLIARLAREAGDRAVDLVERGVTLGGLKAVLQRAALLITNDTGPRHLAAALGTPLVSLFGPTDHRWTTLPFAREHLVRADPFLPEECAADDHPRACAIERIATGDVLHAAKRQLTT